MGFLGLSGRHQSCVTIECTRISHFVIVMVARIVKVLP